MLSFSTALRFSRLSAAELATLLTHKEQQQQRVVVIDVRTAAERADVPPIAGSVSVAVKKRVEDVLEAQTKARQAALASSKGKGKGKGGGKKGAGGGASKQKADAANAASTAVDAASVPRVDQFASLAAFPDDKFASRFGFAKPAPADRLVFVSTGSTRAAELAQSAEAHGYKSVSILEGGMRAWLKYF